MLSRASDLLPAGLVERNKPHDSGVKETSRPDFRQMFGMCEQHGQYPLNSLDDKGCERWRPDVCPACAKQSAVRQLMRRAEISPRFECCTFDGYIATTPDQVQALEVCQSYADSFSDAMKVGRCLILRGNPGIRQ